MWPSSGLTLLLLGVFLVPGFGQTPAHKQLFQQQVISSCQEEPAYLKEVWNLKQAQESPETKEYVLSLDPTEEPPTCRLVDELSYAFDRSYMAPKQREFFQESIRNDTLIATPLEEKASSVELKMQKVLLSSDGSTLLYVESLLIKDYWLYSTQVHIKVQFDQAGRYLTHQLDVNTEVVLVGRGLNARIRGSARY